VGIVRIRHQDKEVGVVLKEFKSRGINKLKSLFLPSKALRAWKGAVNLVEKGIDTAFPIAYVEKRKGGFLDQSFYLAEKIDEAEEIRSLFLKASPEKLQPLLVSLTNYLSVCHQKGVLHRDLSDGNILVKKDEKGKIRFYFLDTNRIRFPKKINTLRRIKNLIRLGVPSPYQSFFLKQYLGEHRRFLWFWYRMNKEIYTGYVAFKRKLRLRQLAQKLKIQ
jgi:serine/threonine protein kinase